MSYNSRNRLETVMDTGATGTRSLTYDNRGHVRTVGGLTMNYNAADRPTGLSGDVQGSHRYDGYGRRVKSIKQTPTGSVVRYNVYDSTGSLAYVVQHDHSDENDDYVMSYVNLDATTSARVKSVGNQVNYTDSVTYLHKDHLGSASSGTDDLGHVIWTESYTPFGIALSPDAANDNQAAFTGHIRDRDTGLTYMQARYYDPVASRFLSIDPVGFMDTGSPEFFNRYSYTANDPINLVDPDGRQQQRPPQTPLSHKIKVAGRAARYATVVALGGTPTEEMSNFGILNQGDAQAAAYGMTAVAGVAMLGGKGGGGARVGRAGTVAKAGCCFVAGTLVETQEGLRPIEEIKVGERVLSRNPKTGETAYKEVTAFIPRHNRVIWEVSLENGNDSELFETTDEHPWWIVNEVGLGSWKRTDELTIGMMVTTADNQTMKVTSVIESGRRDGTYNITVADFETYFVGQNQILVHNCNFSVVSRISENSSLVNAAESAGKNPRVQKAFDKLTGQLKDQNFSNSKPLGNGLHELKDGSGARVYFRNTSNGAEVLGKSDKSSQSQVIKTIKKEFF